ncbi:MAG TPA: ankyrin repeat domain-containing protein [Gammaproteobacteria bacterium]|nr:ankyrin repeat domain-containing protein [Gammaproteobacteria bacterium]
MGTRIVALALMLVFANAANAQAPEASQAPAEPQAPANAQAPADADAQGAGAPAPATGVARVPATEVAPAPVADAAMRRDTEEVRRLLRGGADVNAAQADGATALHWAAYHGDAALAKLLLKAGANASAANREGSTPLWLAARVGDATMIETLLEGGADANEKLPLGRRPLMLAARSGSVDAVRVLLDHGANPNAKEDARGTTALMQAADQGHADVIDVLIQHGAKVAAASAPVFRDGRTAALGKSGDPRDAVRRQVIAILCDEKSPDLAKLRELASDNNEDAKDAASANAARQTSAEADPCKRVKRGPLGFVFTSGRGNREAKQPDGGELTALIYAARSGAIDAARALLAGGADVNQVTRYGWSPLLAATQNRNYQMGKFLIEHGANVNLANKGGWTPLYLATDNRNLEGGDYPTPTADMDSLAYIKLLLDAGANPNARMIESTETRTVFTNQWLDEEGATAFLRASQSGDLVLMKLLLKHGADPHINTQLGVTPLDVAAGIGWVEGITFEWSRAETVEAVKLLLSLGIDPNHQADTGRVALHGAAHKGATEVVRILVAAGARMDIRDFGNTDNRGSPELAAHTWLPIDYADGLVRVGVQSAIPHPETSKVLRELMEKAGLKPPPEGRTLASICIVDVCSPDYNPTKYQ